MATSPPSFQWPQFNIPGFQYQNMIDQLVNSPIGQQSLSNGGQYGRWNGVNNNAFGLQTNNRWPSLFGSPTAPPMQFQPPWGGNGAAFGSNQGPGASPVPGGGMMPPSKVGVQPPPPATAPPPGSGGITRPPGSVNGVVPPSAPPASTGGAPWGVNPQQWAANQALIAGIPAAQRTDPNSAETYLQQQAGAAPGVTNMRSLLGIPMQGTSGPNMANYSAAENPYTAQQIQSLNATNPALALKAYMMDQQAGGRNQFQQLMGWTPDQLNQWINQYNAGGSGYDPTLSAANLPPPGQ